MIYEKIVSAFQGFSQDSGNKSVMFYYEGMITADPIYLESSIYHSEIMIAKGKEDDFKKELIQNFGKYLQIKEIYPT